MPEIYLYVYYQELLRTCDKHISCTCVRKNVIEGIKNIGVETKLFGLHSLRVGGATAAANLGDSHRFFKKVWKMEFRKSWRFIHSRKHWSKINSYEKSKSLEAPTLSMHWDDFTTNNFVFYSLSGG